VMGASSDHLIVRADNCRLAVGSEVSFQLDYSALVSAMTSPFVAKVVKNDVRPVDDASTPQPVDGTAHRLVAPLS